MKYDLIEAISKTEAEGIFASQNEVEVGLCLIKLAYHCEDWRWVQSKCLFYLESSNINLKSIAILSLGHLARVNRQIDVNLVMPRLMSLTSVAELGGQIENTIGDIRMFVSASE